MESALILLAVAGIAAVLVRLARALFRTAHSGTEAFVAGETARTRERRGDLTGMREAGRRQERARQERRRRLAGALAWLALLVAPSLTPWSREIYAAYSLLWLQSARSGRAAPRARGDGDAA